MKRTAVALSLLFVAACASTPPSHPQETTVAPPPAAARSANALTPVSSVAKTITEPRIRVGLVNDQTTVTFPRLPRGYYLVTPTPSATIRRGFTLTAPVSDAAAHYAVQVSTVSDVASANTLAEKLRGDTQQRVDVLPDTAGTAYRVIAGDFTTSNDAQPLRDQLTQSGYGTNLLIVKRPTDQAFEKKHQLVDDEGERVTLDGDSVLIIPVNSDTLTIADKPYRTAAPRLPPTPRP